MVSMKDIAKKCGVSIATVSKALNDHSDIGEATKQKVLAIAKEMGYFPNSSARALKTNKTYNIGVLFVDDARNGLRQDYFSGVLDSFKVCAESNGYDITFINCNKNKSKMSYLEHSRYRGFDGVAIACVDFLDPEVQELIQSDIPVVTIDHVFDNKLSVLSDNAKGMTDLVEFIISQGHRDIAFIHGTDSTTTRNRIGGYYTTMEKYGIPVKDEYIVEARYRRPDVAAELTQKILELPNRPTCIIYPDDYACIGGINVIKKNGLSIPEDISVAGYDGIDISKVLEPKLTTIEQNVDEIGAIAAQRLISLIEKPKTTFIDQVVVEGKLLTGESVKKIN